MANINQKFDSVQSYAIKDLGDYLRYIESLNQEGLLLFRGQRDDWPLLPKLGRKSVTLGEKRNTPNLDKKEISLAQEFKKRATPFFDKQPNCDLELLSIAQHHGLPTRLIDWSTNPLVALWFVVRKGKGGKRRKDYGVVWVYQAEKDHIIKDPEEINFPFNVDRTVVYFPIHISTRIIAQSSVFTVHKYISLNDWFYQFDRNRDGDIKLFKIKVYTDFFDSIRKNLDRYGFNEATMFPDLNGIATYLEWKLNLS